MFLLGILIGFIGYNTNGDGMDIKLKILIREQRIARGISIRNLEVLSGVSRNYISEVERGGKRSIDTYTM